MWGKPVYKEEDGKKVAVIFLDSEGLAASNVSEVYDAKIFAISSLASSLVIYNSIRLIDQASIDYIEYEQAHTVLTDFSRLLSRRAQLFSMKMSLDTEKTITDVTFPPLWWVIQDFYQELKTTPTDYLLDLLKSMNYLCTRLINAGPNKDTNQKSALPEIFGDIKCHTLYFPEISSPETLRHLDRVPMNQLTDEYQEEVRQLSAAVFEAVQPKKRKDQELSGAGKVKLSTSLFWEPWGCCSVYSYKAPILENFLLFLQFGRVGYA